MRRWRLQSWLDLSGRPRAAPCARLCCAARRRRLSRPALALRNGEAALAGASEAVGHGMQAWRLAVGEATDHDDGVRRVAVRTRPIPDCRRGRLRRSPAWAHDRRCRPGSVVRAGPAPGSSEACGCLSGAIRYFYRSRFIHEVHQQDQDRGSTCRHRSAMRNARLGRPRDRRNGARVPAMV